jgi:hypothetical protein
LALLQEAELSRNKAKFSYRDGFRASLKTATDRPRMTDGLKGKISGTSESEDKLATLKAYRRQNNLCFKCGNKWSKEHKCPPQVPLHVIEELLDALEDQGGDCPEAEPDDEVQADTIMSVTQMKAPSSSSRKTMRLCGQIGKTPVLILVDSGSVATFISSNLATELSYELSDRVPTQFVAANGNLMTCSTGI